MVCEAGFWAENLIRLTSYISTSLRLCFLFLDSTLPQVTTWAFCSRATCVTVSISGLSLRYFRNASKAVQTMWRQNNNYTLEKEKNATHVKRKSALNNAVV